ncbi:MAG: Xaa-Pro peptidase family protein [Halobacteriota archaeon]|nr:Xaa-Pro peptidase family protein [Halobacteriota archaeon]
MMKLDQYLKEEDVDGFLMVSESMNCANMYYMTKFLAPDPFTYLKKPEEEMIVVPQMEYERAKKESKVGVRSSLDYGMIEKLREVKDANRAFCEFLFEILQKEEIKRVLVPLNFSIYTGDELRKRGIEIEPVGGLVENERLIKEEGEMRYIRKAQKACEEAMQVALSTIEKAKIRDDTLIYDGEILTVEKVKSRMIYRLIELGCASEDLIVACGNQASDPHCSGSGPLMAGEPIIIDIFPRLMKERYCADMSRTISVGEPSDYVFEMYEAVLTAQERAIEMIRSGISCADVHNAVCDVFEDGGYGTIRRGDHTGFIHSTGHGVGLDIHEKPTISENDYELKAGNVITIEPGLYYPDVGGVRIEDLLLVREKGYENLSIFEKKMLI